ncbi:hypothetical protein ACIP98_37855 [Streptomyces sp. NPDC088354]|uniref:hypothetical protein n=1 Tax=Streptomyces sp. NPDC088354 TaxID=3365856 RepID=UPI00381D417F
MPAIWRRTCSGRYSTASPRDEALHDWGGVHEELHQFVLIDRSAGRITLLVAADD